METNLKIISTVILRKRAGMRSDPVALEELREDKSLLTFLGLRRMKDRDLEAGEEGGVGKE